MDNASLIDDLRADSLDMVELVLKFEREFGFEISDDAVECILTVGDAVELTKKHAVTRTLPATTPGCGHPRKAGQSDRGNPSVMTLRLSTP